MQKGSRKNDESMTPSPPYSQLDELDAHLPDDVTEQVAKLAYLLQAELVEW